ncbi:MAG: arginyl-tRNA--protein-N-Asp/Glu arginylyltransferase [Verrucomicrobiales bacterium]|jgi:arginyl-tRNA--protein-N-Asp/Glu arginylyltransferase
MIFQQLYPAQILPHRLDQFLAEGWYRRGQSIFTTAFVATFEGLFDAPWLRLDVRKHKFRKRLRRLMRQNGELFEIRSGPARIDDEKREMTEIFRQEFKGDYYESLEDALYGDRPLSSPSVFTTHQIELFFEGRLIGFSFFDLGKSSMASILGIYDHEFSRHSLGLYTMLLEIEKCQREGLDFYYPGYAMPGNPRFDYKLRLGELDFLEPISGDWKPWSDFSEKTSPRADLRAEIARAQAVLPENWGAGAYFNFEAPCEFLARTKNAEFLQSPLFLAPKDHAETSRTLVIEFNQTERLFRLSRFEAVQALPFPHHKRPLDFLSLPAHFDVADFIFLGSLVREEILGETCDSEGLPALVRSAGG